MKFTLNWLKEHLETDADLNAITETLTRIGLEVEHVTNPAERLAPFTIVEVLSAEKHPDADKLRVCQVTDGRETRQIVCGAPNARQGMKAVLGRPGDYVPGLDLTLKKAKIRGVESSGMMCSARELELGDEHDGILDLADDAPVGAVYAEYAGLDDPVIEIAITPNRQDCLGVHGIARDLAAAGLGVLKPIRIPDIAVSFDSGVAVHIAEDARDRCPVFLGRMFRGVKNGPSPRWLQDRLKGIGLRPISALVDITNYLTFAYGRPAHVYDAGKLKGDLQVRQAVAGETFVALDDREYTADGSETVIADEAGPTGFGGIIGGADSGVDDATTDVVLEIALFDPVVTAMTGRRHGLITDARYRFERGVDARFAETGLALASRLILDLCGGEAGSVFHDGMVPLWNKTVPFRPSRVASLGGLDLPAERSFEILTGLGFVAETEDTDNKTPVRVKVPSWRVDVDGEADLVEEVLRIHGYDAIPFVKTPVGEQQAGQAMDASLKRARLSRRRLAAEGLHEAVTWSFMNRSDAALFADTRPGLIIDNPIASALDYMRPSILPNLLKAAQRNHDRGITRAALFEVGPVYLDDTPDGQLRVATGVRVGPFAARHWDGDDRMADAYDVKADALATLDAVGAPMDSLQVVAEAPAYFHPGRSGMVCLGPKTVLAVFGELHPRVLKSLDVDGPAVGFEVFIDRVPPRRRRDASKGALHLSNLQAVERDFAFLVDHGVAAGDLIKAVSRADKAHIKAVQVFDVYEGKGVPDGQRSLAVSVYLEPQKATFSETEIEAISARICAAAEKAVGARLRG